MSTQDQRSDGLPHRALWLGESIGALLVAESHDHLGAQPETAKALLSAATRSLHLTASMLGGFEPHHDKADDEAVAIDPLDQVKQASLAAVNAMTELHERVAGDFDHQLDTQRLQKQAAELVDISIILIDKACEIIQA